MELSRDFYYFRVGQFASTLGTFAGMIAMTWWVLEKTSSPASLGMIMAFPKVLDTIVDPLIAPISDFFNKKKLLAFGNFWCFFSWTLLAIFAYFDFFQFMP